MKMHSPGHSSADSTTTRRACRRGLRQALGAARVGEDLVAFLDVGEAVVEQGEDGGGDFLAQAIAGAQILVVPDGGFSGPCSRSRRSKKVRAPLDDSLAFESPVPKFLTLCIDDVEPAGADHQASDDALGTLNTGLGSETIEEVPCHGHGARAQAGRLRGASRPTSGDDQGPRVMSSLPPPPVPGHSLLPLEGGSWRPRGQSPRPPPRTRNCGPRFTHTSASPRCGEDVEKLTMPPSGYGTFLGTNDDGTAASSRQAARSAYALHPELHADDLHTARRSCSTSPSTSCSPTAPRSPARS